MEAATSCNQQKEKTNFHYPQKGRESFWWVLIFCGFSIGGKLLGMWADFMEIL